MAGPAGVGDRHLAQAQRGDDDVPTTWFIEDPTLEAYRTILEQGDMPKWLASSFITSAAVALGTVITASMAAYALSRLRFRWQAVRVLCWCWPGS